MIICHGISSVVGCYEHDHLGSIEAGNFFSESMSVNSVNNAYVADLLCSLCCSQYGMLCSDASYAEPQVL